MQALRSQPCHLPRRRSLMPHLQRKMSPSRHVSGTCLVRACSCAASPPMHSLPQPLAGFAIHPYLLPAHQALMPGTDSHMLGQLQKRVTLSCWCRDWRQTSTATVSTLRPRFCMSSRLGTAFPNLTQLDLSRTSGLMDRDIERLSGLPGLAGLSLVRCRRVTDVAVLTLATRNPDLLTLNLARCHSITGTAFEALELVSSGHKLNHRASICMHVARPLWNDGPFPLSCPGQCL